MGGWSDVPGHYLDGDVPAQYKVRGVEGEPASLAVLEAMQQAPEAPWTVGDRLSSSATSDRTSEKTGGHGVPKVTKTISGTSGTAIPGLFSDIEPARPSEPVNDDEPASEKPEHAARVIAALCASG
jgi:hypothetical protein